MYTKLDYAGTDPASWPEARTADGTYKDMVREMSATNFTNVEDEAKYWLDHYDVNEVEAALQDAGYGYSFAKQVLNDILG